MRAVACSAFLFGVAPSILAPSAFADEVATTAAAVTLKVTPGTAGSPWRLQIANDGDGPVRIPADARLLVLELTPPAATIDSPKKKPAPTTPRCILPDDARPSGDDGRDLVIPAKRSWSTTFDPLFYCFGARERAALVAGTSVKATFGFPAPPPRPGARPVKEKPPAAPFAVVPVGASVGKVAPAKAITADAFTLSEAVPTVSAPPSEEGASPDVVLSVPETLDAARGADLTTTVTLSNQGERAITLLYRPEMLRFTVSGPAGTVSCGTPREFAPIRELLSTVGPKGKLETSVLVTTVCPSNTFQDPGVYRVLPRFDAAVASGRSVGIKTWDGVAAAKAPLLVRVRTSRTNATPPRPTLD